LVATKFSKGSKGTKISKGRITTNNLMSSFLLGREWKKVHG